MGFFQSLKEDLSTAVNELIMSDNDVDEAPIIPGEDDLGEEIIQDDKQDADDLLIEENGVTDEEPSMFDDIDLNKMFDEILADDNSAKETVAEETIAEETTASETEEKHSVRDALNSLKNASRRYEKQRMEELAQDEKADAVKKKSSAKKRSEKEELPADDEILSSLMEEYKEKMDIDDDKEAQPVQLSFEDVDAMENIGIDETEGIAEVVTEETEEVAEEITEVVTEEAEEVAEEITEEVTEEAEKVTEEVSEVIADEKDETTEEVEREVDDKVGVIEELNREIISNNESGAEENNIMTEEAMTEETVSDETAIITEGMVIKGNVESNGNMDLGGTVKGNIDILGKLNVTGKIEGDTKAGEVFADGAEINGAISAKGSVKVGQSTVIIGNVSANGAVIAGAIKGDIDVHGPVVLDSTAIVMGNIKSASVQINNGAVVEGLCSQCYATVSPASFFEEFKKSAKKL